MDRADVATELQRSWVRKLYAWRRHYNEDYLDGALALPLIELGGVGAVLGSWDAKHRRMRIAAGHIAADPWLRVLDTLRHEMAHQYACEVLQASHESPHGEAFSRACEKLRCQPAARASVAGKRDETDQLLQRLQKVLSLTDSSNEHEAETAVKKARLLLLTYNIDVVELDRERSFGQRCLGSIKGRRASYELWLAAILQDFFFVETLWVRTYRAQENKVGTVLEIYGTPANLDMADYVYAYLSGLIERLWSDYKRRQGLTANRERQRYWAGILEGFHDKLREQERAIGESPAEAALVWRGDDRLRDYYRHINPRISTRYGTGVADSAAYRDGLEEGQKVQIHKPVESAEGFGGYLQGA